jgi:hypothetical protein
VRVDEMGGSLRRWTRWYGKPTHGRAEDPPDGSSPSDKRATGYSILEAEDMAGAEAPPTGSPAPRLGRRLRD